MIKASELRIGNWVIYKSFNCQWAADDFAELVYNTGNLINPILITKEWLLKFGFEKKEPYGWKGNGYDYQPETSKTEYLDYVIDAGDEDYFFVRYSTWSHRKDEDSEWISDTNLVIHKGSWYEKAEEHVSCKKIQYIHQLQNLYFALTGLELETKNL